MTGRELIELLIASGSGGEHLRPAVAALLADPDVSGESIVDVLELAGTTPGTLAKARLALAGVTPPGGLPEGRIRAARVAAGLPGYQH